MVADDRRIRIITGHYGSGKTEFAVNYVKKLRESVDGRVAIADLDIVNVYFRSREKKEELEEKGIQLREPYSKMIEDGIFEIRCKVGNNISRVLYFFYFEGKIILTNGFVKKTQKTPKEEIQIAKDRRKDFIERMMRDEDI